MAKEAVTVSGDYKESDDFVPNPADMQGQFNTSGLGASGKIEEVSSVFEADKVQVAQQITDALDPKSAVPANRVILPDATESNEEATKSIKAAAKERLDKGVVINGPTPAEREAAEKTDENARAEGNAAAKKSDSSAKKAEAKS